MSDESKALVPLRPAALIPEVVDGIPRPIKCAHVLGPLAHVVSNMDNSHRFYGMCHKCGEFGVLMVSEESLVVGTAPLDIPGAVKRAMDRPDGILWWSAAEHLTPESRKARGLKINANK